MIAGLLLRRLLLRLLEAAANCASNSLLQIAEISVSITEDSLSKESTGAYGREDFFKSL